MTARLMHKSWWTDFRFNHKRYRKRSPVNSRAGALAYEATLRQKLARGENIENITPPKDELFEQFAWKWFAEYVVSNNKYSEQITKKYILSSSLIPFFGTMYVRQITGHTIEQFKAQALKRGLSNKTLNNQLTVLRKCVTTAYEWLRLTGTPPKILRLKPAPPKTDYLSVDECSLLLSQAEGIVYEMILTALRTGMRQGELKGLQWSSIDWQNRTIAVRHSRCDYTRELSTPKGNRERHIPITADIYEMLLHRRTKAGYVFLDVDGKPFDHDRLSRRLSKVCQKAGLRKIGWHTLRHTFASHLVMRGASLSVVQMLLGHTTIAMTERYTHLGPSALRSAIDLLHQDNETFTDCGQPVGKQLPEREEAKTDQMKSDPKKPLRSLAKEGGEIGV